MVGESNSAMTETWWPIFSWSRLISTAPWIELPPSSKKLSSTPTCSTRSTSRQRPARNSSRGVLGAT